MTEPLPKTDIAALFETLYTCGTGHDWTAELVDENDPNGAVVLKDKDGTPRMWMPRDVYEEIRNT